MAYHRVYDSRHLQADCQEPGSATEPYAQQSSMGYLHLYNLAFIFSVLKLWHIQHLDKLLPVTVYFHTDGKQA